MTHVGGRPDGERPRWRDRPRESMWRWDRPGSEVIGFPVMVVYAYMVAGHFLVEAFTRDGIAAPLRAAGIGLTTLAVALGMTWFAVLYLQRPVEHDPPKPEKARLPPAVSREEVEAAAQRFRQGPSM